jgi:phage shock protein PspC (stress-responsive transcriptional regulator)
MTTSDTVGGYPPPSPTSQHRLLRRNKTNRVAAGVCSGLGDYFGLDPVLFRVLFATAAFFGGAGILAYLLAWAAIPEAGTEHAPIDGLIGWMRRRRFPVWLAVAVAGLILWAVAFSWWAPGPFLPVIAIVVLVIVFFARRDMQAAPQPPPATPDTMDATVNLTKAATVPADVTSPTWSRDARAWYDEARTASRERRRRALPVRIAILATLFVTLTVLALIDAFHGIQFQIYFWTTLGIVGAGLLTGLVLRRFPLSMTILLWPAIAGAVAFGGSHASLHDGVGQREWKPTSQPASDYRLAFGQGTLDLTALDVQTQPRIIHITMAAGQVKIIAPPRLNLTVLGNIHFGQVETAGSQLGDTRHSGVGLSRIVGPPRNATGAPITVDVHIADGSLTVGHP